MRSLSYLLISLLSLGAFSQSKNEVVTLDVKNQELEIIFDSLSNQTGYFFSYNSDLLPKGSLYAISANELPIDQFLSKLLVGTNLKYSFYKEQIIINYERPPAQEIKRKNFFEVSGRVLDENGEALIGVNVFLDGTSLGVSTDIDGNYRIDKIPPGYYDLVFSYIGYENAVYSLSEYNGGARIQRHNMVPAINELEEVQIVADRIDRNADQWFLYYEVFKRDLFGSSEEAEFCEITNPDVVDFTYDNKNNELKAFASAPLKIINHAIGYDITYYLESFEKNNDGLRYRGQIKFESRADSLGKFSKRELRIKRKKSYLGSWTHFKKSLLKGTLKKDGFRLYAVQDLSNISYLKRNQRSESDIVVFKGSYWELDFNNHIAVVYLKERESINFLIDEEFSSILHGDVSAGVNRGKQTSLLKLLKGPVRIDLNGQVVDRFALTTFGYWSWERLANLVPINYDPKFDNF